MTRKIRKINSIAILAVAFICVLGILPAFAAGLGRPVGVIQQVQGEVSITHDDERKGFEAKRGMRLYKGDTIRTLDNGRLRMRLNDGSIISLASNTKLKLTRSVYAKKKKSRSSFFSMTLGKARFFVVKLLDFKRSEFRVKTPTAVCGVRGSDFILEATATETIEQLILSLKEARTIVMVSHDMAQVERVADRWLELSEGRIVNDWPNNQWIDCV